MTNRTIAGLSDLTAPATDDLFIAVDVSETAGSATSNKKITYSNILRNIPSGTEVDPAISFTADSGTTGLYRSAANEIAFSANESTVGKFTTTGLQLGTGAAAAQLHLFSPQTIDGNGVVTADTTDQVIIENTDSGLDTAPDLVLYRNSASPADNDNLGNIEFRGRNDNSQDHVYAQILAQIVDASDGTEDGIIDIMASQAGTVASRIRISGDSVGINEPSPLFALHVTESVENTALYIESKIVDTGSSANVVLYHHRNSAAGQDNDVLSSLLFKGNNDAGTPVPKTYGSVVASIVDASNTEEDGKLDLKVQAAGTLTSMAAITAANITLGARPIIPTLTPASATATGIAGEVAWDANYIYVCIATNTWKRVALSTWS